MSSLSKLKKLFGSPQGFGVCHKRNRGASRETKWVSLPCTKNSLDLSKQKFMLVFALYNLMLKSNFSPDEYTFSILIDRFCKSGRTNEVLEILDEMERCNTPPNTIIFTSVISGLCQEKKVDYAYSLFNKVKGNWFQPNLACYNVLLDEFCKLGRFDEALSIVQLLERDGARRYHEAYSWYAKMFKVGVMPNVVLYAVIMPGLSEEGRVGFCDIGLLDRARSLQLQISKNDQFPDACTYNILMSGMCRDGRVGEAQNFFNNMEKLGCFPSVVTFNALINELGKAGQLEEAFLLYCKMETGKIPLLFLGFLKVEIGLQIALVSRKQWRKCVRKDNF
ncbi:pentatricopeptide repeat-containing protein [Senna tora]|uniref:Pentatricopeptide repeat-containing protein n=1 Tax=Senna tora TaxID=362788 RepID=A0A834TRV9_9FABA|nr:pentatricopeptide repeat-containing protein [Senna tora]